MGRNAGSRDQFKISGQHFFCFKTECIRNDMVQRCLGILHYHFQKGFVKILASMHFQEEKKQPG